MFCVFFLFYFIFKLYIIVLVLPNIKMNPPQVYMCSPSGTLLPPPSPYQYLVLKVYYSMHLLPGAWLGLRNWLGVGMAWPRAFPSHQESSGVGARGNMQEAAQLNPDPRGLLRPLVMRMWSFSEEVIQRNHSYYGKLTQKADSNLFTYSSVQQTFTDAHCM